MRSIRSLWDKFLGRQLYFRVRLFNLLAIGGVLISFIMLIYNLMTYPEIEIHAGTVLGILLSAGLLVYSSRTGNYRICYMITIVTVFLILFPIFFIFGGGYQSGMPSFFMFAVLFTTCMLQGKAAYLMAGVELMVYAALFMLAYLYPNDYPPLTGANLVVDIIVCFFSTTIILAFTLIQHFRLYDEQQKQLAKQNAALDHLNHLKSELFGNVSHELKTPLTVISVHIQRAEKLFELSREGDAEKIRESFALVQDEITRMSRLINNALRLAAFQESGTEKSTIDPGGILRAGAQTYITLLEKNGNRLTLDIPETMPSVAGSADALVQILANLLSNANTYTKNGHIHVRAIADVNRLTVSVEDDGAGIAPEVYARVFERGVTGGGGGSGLGLPICEQLVQFYGGDITLVSKPGKGTCVSFTLPVYAEVT